MSDWSSDVCSSDLAFASHFAPAQLLQALEIYRSRFKPSKQLDRPYAMVGANVIAADSDREARRLATTQPMSFAGLFRGARGLRRPPLDDIERYWPPLENAQTVQRRTRSVGRARAHVRAGSPACM